MCSGTVSGSTYCWSVECIVENGAYERENGGQDGDEGHKSHEKCSQDASSARYQIPITGLQEDKEVYSRGSPNFVQLCSSQVLYFTSIKFFLIKSGQSECSDSTKAVFTYPSIDFD